MAVKYLAGERIIGTAAERAALATYPQSSWKELDRASGGSQVMDTGTFDTKENLMVIFNRTGDGVGGQIRFNNDQGGSGSSNTYIRKYSYSAPASGSDAGGTWGDQQGETGINIYGNSNAGANYTVMFIDNHEDTEKLLIWNTIEEGSGTGAGNPVRSMENVGKWINSDDQINRIAIDAGSGNTFASDTEMIVLGYNYDEATTGDQAYWQQIANSKLDTDDTNGGSVTDPQLSATWTGGYKYLWVQGFVGCSTDWKTTFDEVDANGDYTWNYQDNGGTYTNVGSNESSAGFHVSGSLQDNSFNAMIINNSGKEKLYWNDGNAISTSGTAVPTRRMLFGKDTFGSGQINSIRFFISSGTFYAGSRVTVWGAN